LVAAQAACGAADLAAAYSTCKTPDVKTNFPPDREKWIKVEQQQQIVLLRDITGDPFRAVAIHPAWLAYENGTIAKLAQAAYDERQLPSGLLDPIRLAVLADALEEAGCKHDELLRHLRGPGEHVRGCWLLDLLLEKA
jgi:hypothetical protein